MSLRTTSRSVLTFLSLSYIVLILGAGIATVRATDGVSWKSLGSGGGGNMVVVSVKPDDASVVLMGSDVGGIFLSTDSGQTWSLRNNGFTMPGHIGGNYGTDAFPVGTNIGGGGGGFAWDPTNTEIVYNGMRRSTDHGQSWGVYVDDSNTEAAGSLVDGTRSSYVYAFGLGNVYRSTNGFTSGSYQASCLPPTPCPNDSKYIYSMVIDPHNHDVLLACAEDGLYESTDTATTWSKLSPGVPNNGGCSRLTLFNDGSLHGKLYMAIRTTPAVYGAASTQYTPDQIQGGVYESDDFGGNWTGGYSIGTNPDIPVTVYNSSFDTYITDPTVADGWDVYCGASNPNCINGLYGSVQRDASVTHDAGTGKASLKVDVGDDVHGASTYGARTSGYIAVGQGKRYRVSGWFKTDYASGTGFPIVVYVELYTLQNGQYNPFYWPGSTRQYTSPIDFSGHASVDWSYAEGMFRVPDEVTHVKLFLYGTGVRTTTHFDSLALEEVHALPRIAGTGFNPYVLDYSTVVPDPTDSTVLYTGVRRNTCVDSPEQVDTCGVYKSTDSGATWDLVTRANYRDNVKDGIISKPTCGNGVCEGRWENCQTCPSDCTGTCNYPSGAYCGDWICNGTETTASCPTDCRLDPDPNRTAYFEPSGFSNGITSPAYTVWDIDVGHGAGTCASGAGHCRVFFGAGNYVSTNAGDTWENYSSSLDTSGPEFGVWKQNGATTDTFAYSVVSDSRKPGRLYYGDHDNRLMVSYNGGVGFRQEGYNDWFSLGLDAGCASSILPSASSADTIYVGATFGGFGQGGTDTCPSGKTCSSVLQANYTPATQTAAGSWQWSIAGSGLPTTSEGGVDLVQPSPGGLMASLYQSGIYYMANNSWQARSSGWNIVPAGVAANGKWETNRLVKEPVLGRIYVAVGDAVAPISSQPLSHETGIWETSDTGQTWTLVSDTSMDKEPVTDIVTLGPNAMLATTWYGLGDTSNSNGTYTGDGGLYLGTRASNGTWTWTRKIAQPNMTGIAASRIDNSILYAIASQVCCSGAPMVGQAAGLYRSLDGGATWAALPNAGLQNLSHARIDFSQDGSNKVYASTLGDGTFEGTVSCTDPVHDFACAPRLTPTAVGHSQGILISDSSRELLDIKPGSDDDSYVVYQEGAQNKKLAYYWTFPAGTTGTSYKLRVEGFKVPGGDGTGTADDFYFSVATRTSGTCTGSETYGSTILTVNGLTDNDVVSEASVGVQTAGTFFCVRVLDSSGNGADSVADQLYLDKVYLMPLNADVANAETDSDSIPADTGTFTGNYTYTQAPDESPTELTEVLQEAVVGFTSKLIHTWTFNVASGSTHKLHFEGSRPDNTDGDNFQFSWSTSISGTYTDISGALISSATENAGGTDSSTFGPSSYSGTIYIRVHDTNQQSGKNHQDTVSIDHLAVLTVP